MKTHVDPVASAAFESGRSNAGGGSRALGRRASGGVRILNLGDHPS